MQIVVIGGGAAGFFAAAELSSRKPSTQVIILEQSPNVLGKVKVSGGGRCNVTHNCFDVKQLATNYPRGEKALIGPFTRFNPEHTLNWFAKKGVKIKAEADGRMFPVTDSSQTIIDCLLKTCIRNGVKVFTRKGVSKIQPHENALTVICTDGSEFIAEKLIVAAGSSPKIWQMLQDLGHTIVPPVPSLFTFNISDDRIKNLPGLSVPLVEVKVAGTKLKSHGPLLITHWGMSGPAVLRLSAWGARILHEKNYNFTCIVNWTGTLQFEEVQQKLMQEKNISSLKQPFSSALFAIPSRLWQSLVSAATILPGTKWADVSKKQINLLALQISAAEFKVNGKSTFKDEFVTCGGVSLKEIDFKTMESRKIKNLYFAGEVIDVDAITGGFNFQAAWTTAYIAAETIAQEL